MLKDVFFFLSEPAVDDSQLFTDDESILDEEEKALMAENGHIDVNGNASQLPKKTVAQIMRDKKKQTSLTLQWWVTRHGLAC